ncbi:hypothetical protein LP419_39210 [Massilia sp. H-1]|nr:hypothetical protein LP419_39210 [Massilia sp. H-1]
MMAASGQVNVIERAVLIADMISGLLEPVASTVSQDFQSYTYRWVPHERAIMRTRSAEGNCTAREYGETGCVEAIDLDDGGKIRPLFKDWYTADRGYGSWFPDVHGQASLPSGSRLEFASWRAAFDNTSACFGTGPDQYLFGTLLNMTADLRVLRSGPQAACSCAAARPTRTSSSSRSSTRSRMRQVYGRPSCLGVVAAGGRQGVYHLGAASLRQLSGASDGGRSG